MVDLSTWAADWTQEQASPSFLIDCDKAAVLAANTPGLLLLRISSEGILPLSLDSTMPAVTRLRLLARTCQTERPKERLTFWIDGTVRQLNCQVRAVKNGVASPHLYQIVVIEQAPELQLHSSGLAMETKYQPDVEQKSIAEPDEPLRIVRDDRETLKEIARRIRETEISWAMSAPQAHDKIADVETVSADANPETQKPAEIEVQKALAPETSNLQSNPISGIESFPNGLTDADLARLAHELKTPISAIATASEIMRDERLGSLGSPVYRDYAADIHNSAKHALDVINTTLNRAQAGIRQNDPQTIEINDLVSEAVSSLQPIARERDLDLGFDPEAISPMLVTNPTAVRQIVLNLLTNAIKYTPGGGVIRAATGYLDDGAVFVVVRDTGIGFDPDAPKVAIPGKSTRASASGRLEGSNGIGLPLVHQLADGIGAEVEIDSAPGRGTVALLAFPRSASSY